MLLPGSSCVTESRLVHSNRTEVLVRMRQHVGVMSWWPFNLSSKQFTMNDRAQPANRIRTLFVVYRERPGESSLEGILVASVEGHTLREFAREWSVSRNSSSAQFGWEEDAPTEER